MAIRAERERAKLWELPQIGSVLAAKYEIREVIGQGGLAIVFSAMHLQLEQRVAIKLLLPEWANHEEVIERFQREGRASIKIRSEHVVRVFDVDTLPSGAPYIVMEHLDGTDLEALVDRDGPLPVTTAVDYVLQSCEAIAEAHAAGIIHRDLKPANLFLTTRADGSACIKVLDFGISKNLSLRPSELDLTSPEAVMGSPNYMSPEQLQSTANVDERSDIWGLGAILHELLSGAPPFTGDTGPQVCVNVMQETPTALGQFRPDVPAALEATVLLCLEKDPSKRFNNVGELAMALASYGPPDHAHASADITVRVLQAAGIIRTSASGLWLANAPCAVDVRQAPHAHAPPVTSDTRSTDPTYRVKRRSPMLVTTLLLGGLGMLFGGFAFARHEGLFTGAADAQSAQAAPAEMPTATAEATPPATAPTQPKTPETAAVAATTAAPTVPPPPPEAADTAVTYATGDPPNAAPTARPTRATRANRWTPPPRAATPQPEPTAAAPSPTSASPYAPPPPATTSAPPATAPTATSKEDPNGLFDERK